MGHYGGAQSKPSSSTSLEYSGVVARENVATSVGWEGEVNGSAVSKRSNKQGQDPQCCRYDLCCHLRHLRTWCLSLKTLLDRWIRMGQRACGRDPWRANQRQECIFLAVNTHPLHQMPIWQLTLCYVNFVHLILFSCSTHIVVYLLCIWHSAQCRRYKHEKGSLCHKEITVGGKGSHVNM